MQLDDDIRAYWAMRRERVPAFVDRHFSFRGTLALHRAAIGWDILRAPINLVLAGPAAALHVAAAVARRLGARRLADALARRQLLLRTALADRLAWLISVELLEFPREATQPDRRVERTLDDYAATRIATGEIAAGLFNLGTGAFTLGKLTPGAVTFAPILASLLAQQAAISSFPFGAALGAFWYGLFPVAPAASLLFGLSVGLLLLGSVLASFAGVVTDPIQRLLGMHQRRLLRMIAAMERQMLDAAAPGYAASDRYVARLLDALDLAAAAHRLIR